MRALFILCLSIVSFSVQSETITCPAQIHCEKGKFECKNFPENSGFADLVRGYDWEKSFWGFDHATSKNCMYKRIGTGGGGIIGLVVKPPFVPVDNGCFKDGICKFNSLAKYERK